MSDAPCQSTRRPRVVLLTGVTGFVGQALLERFLREGAEVHAVVRSQKTRTAARRLDDLLEKSAFDTWRNEVGPEGVVHGRARLHVVDADLATGLPALPADLDLVVHSASCVSFDAPWDEAVRANVVGPRNLYLALLRSGASPHVVHVSTSYVGTDRADVALERSVAHAADWRTETEAALDFQSRCTGDDSETLRREAGRNRARALGWTDVYTMTKALGERVAEELWAGTGHRLTVLRPTIIESALSRPHPGWIDGFKVADPLIAAFAKDRLVAFPGRPEAVLDIVPVDVVVDAAMAAAAVPHREPGARYFQVGTGVSNPITLDEFREHVESAIRADPWTDRDGNPIRPRAWRFLSPDRLDAWAGRRVAALGVLTRTLSVLPAGVATRTRHHVEAASRSLTMLRNYVDIYQPYTCSRTVYDDTQTRSLLAEAKALGMEGELDVTRIDWRHYLREVHMPSLGRMAIAHRRRAGTRPAAPVTPLAADRPVTDRRRAGHRRVAGARAAGLTA